MKPLLKKIKFAIDEGNKKRIVQSLENQNKKIWMYKFLSLMLCAVGGAAAAATALICTSINDKFENATPLSPVIIIALSFLVMAAFCAVGIGFHLAKKDEVRRLVDRRKEKLIILDDTLRYTYRETKGKHRGHDITIDIPINGNIKASYDPAMRKITFTGIYKVRFEHPATQKVTHDYRRGLVLYDCYSPSLHHTLCHAGVNFSENKGEKK